MFKGMCRSGMDWAESLAKTSARRIVDAGVASLRIGPPR
jgi:hypothetical protein